MNIIIGNAELVLRLGKILRKTSTMDPGIICFQHCGPKIFCFSLPEICPVCKGDLNNSNFSLLPFRIPYPFIQASQYPCAVVIKPTTGDFLNDYLNSKDLHVGVTTSRGNIVEFDKNGLRHHRSKQWGQCLLLDQVPGPWRDHWDDALEKVCSQECWSSELYREDTHNSLARGMADACTESNCQLSNNCRCSSAIGPLGEDIEQYPQLISLTFDDAVTTISYNNYWKPLLFERLNPDGGIIGATFFVPHDKSNYQTVNDLYNAGFEIGVNSITKNDSDLYWSQANQSLLELEFGGQKTILATFACIPEEQIIGVRTPQFQLAGDNSMKAFTAAGFQYDSSWPTTPDKPLFPYTMDHLSTQECTSESACPTEAHNGFWILPIIDLNGNEEACNSLTACNITGTSDEISEWLTNEINSVRNTTRAPLTLVVNSKWFTSNKNSYDGFVQFLDGLQDLSDVFLVSQSQVLEWMRNPVPLSEFKTIELENGSNCKALTCRVKKDKLYQTMGSCATCPKVYPWLGNPTGVLKP
ncbi:hypothetical protein JTB14_006830 [Gonioctena quinquepunctata]|nr:hypothetical protein JTB14_006830 [Gonioctena quinquepunctata]